MKNLWPEDIGEFVPSRLPVTVLKEQAAMLGQMTKNVVEGRVSKDYSGNFSYSLLLKPASFTYSYLLLRIDCQLEGYPVTISPETDVKKEIGLDPDKALRIDSEEELLECLKKIFNTEKVKRVVAALIAQVQQGTEP